MLEPVKIYKGDEVKAKLIEGCQKMSEAVGTTFGPNSANVAITMLYNLPHVTKDGVTVANSINLEDPIENVACQIIKEAARKTAEVAGDGTTSTTILTSSIVKACINTDYNKLVLKKELEEKVKELEDFVKSKSIEIKTDKQIENIAFIASNGDKNITSLVSDTIKQVGKDGSITVMPSKTYLTTVEVSDGIHLDRGYIDPILQNKNSSKDIFENCKILVADLDLHTVDDALSVIGLCEEIKAPLLIICNDIHAQALEIIAYNKWKFNLDLQIVRAPFIADARKEGIKDIALCTGAVPLFKDRGWTFQGINASQLGEAPIVTIAAKDTVITGRKGDAKEIEERILYYKDLIVKDHEGLGENYRKRLAMLSSGAAVIHVGGTNEIEQQETRDRLDDTIRAVKAALEEGVVPGALGIYMDLKNYLDKQTGSMVNTVLELAICSLYDSFMTNIEATKREDLMQSFKENKNIIDPTKVILSTIKNSIGAACMIFTTETVVVKEVNKLN